MAKAVCDDISRHGGEHVAALVVSHSDAEDLADRVRARLAATGQLTGPALVGPGWTADREYQAGDRVLLHARCGPSGSLLVNGTAATITYVDDGGLAVRLDGSGEATTLPTAFVQGTRKDGSPNVSHSWARTVDGAQGGTWEACHLLGSAALDAYRGYTGQSRSRQPTHTWNTARIAVVDHGGALANQRDAAEAVADALGRRPDPTLAARSDPWALDRQLRDQIAEHERVLAARPPGRREAVATATKDLESAEDWLANMDAVASHTAHEVDALGPLTGLSRRGRKRRRVLHDKLAADTGRATAARDERDDVAGRVARFRREQEAFERFEAAEGWRRDDIPRLQDQLDHHWAEVITLCVRADDPLAYGVGKLRHARATVAADLRDLDARAPADRADEHDAARRQLAEVLRTRQQAERALDAARAALNEARRRRWGRQDRHAVASAEAGVVFAEQRLERADAIEHELSGRAASLARHQQERQDVAAATAARRDHAQTTLSQFDAALNHIRADRTRALAEGPPQYLVERLGPVPGSPAGRAVWCHHALGIEAALDRNDGASPLDTGWSPDAGGARREIAIADRLLHVSGDPVDPAEWAKLAGQAAALRNEAERLVVARTAIARLTAPAQGVQHGYGMGVDAADRGPEL